MQWELELNSTTTLKETSRTCWVDNMNELSLQLLSTMQKFCLNTTILNLWKSLLLQLNLIRFILKWIIQLLSHSMSKMSSRKAKLFYHNKTHGNSILKIRWIN